VSRHVRGFIAYGVLAVLLAGLAVVVRRRATRREGDPARSARERSASVVLIVFAIGLGVEAIYQIVAAAT
jgi:hypothetical protein